MNVFWKTDHLPTRTEIHLLLVHDRHTHACTIQKYQALDNRLPGLLLQMAFLMLLTHKGAFHGLWVH